MNSTQKGYVERELEERRLKLLYVAPERLFSPSFIDQLLAWGHQLSVPRRRI